jgi:predicted kinase
VLHADGISVVLDGTFSTLDILNQARGLAADRRSVFLAVECKCRSELARERIAKRLTSGSDVSDATPEIHDIQQMRWEPWPADFSQVRVNTELPLQMQVEHVIAALMPYAPG